MPALRLPGRVFLGNLVALYGIQFASLLLPLVTLPYLTRVLRPEAWGQLGAIQSLGNVFVLFIEYGFLLSATRAVAQQRAHPERLARIVSGVLGAKLLLLAALLVIAGLVFVSVGVVRATPRLYWAGVAFAVAQGFSPLWYYQGIERLRGAAIIDVAARALGVLSIFVFVREPAHAPRVLALQAVFYALSVLLNTARLYRDVPFRKPAWADAVASLKDGWTLFLVRGAVTLYTTANAFVLRLFVPAASVANYVNADRLTSAGKGVLVPFSQLLFPRIANVIQSDREQARRLVKGSMFVMVGLGLTGALFAFLLAPFVVRLLFGPGYAASVALLRILVLTLPVIAVSNVLGVQWMLPLGLDRAFNTIITVAGGLNIMFAVVLARFYGATGMAWSVLLSESFVTLAMLAYLWRYKHTPFRKAGNLQ